MGVVGIILLRALLWTFSILHSPFSILRASLALSLASMMTTESPASPARAGADDDEYDDESDTPPETPQQKLSALCADIDFNDDLPQATNLGHGILTLLPLPPLRALQYTSSTENFCTGTADEISTVIQPKFQP